MLKVSGKAGDGRVVMMLGLSHVNVERLRAGRPIMFDAAELGVDAHVVIFVGETEQTMAGQLADLIGSDPMVRIDPKLRS